MKFIQFYEQQTNDESFLTEGFIQDFLLGLLLSASTIVVNPADAETIKTNPPKTIPAVQLKVQDSNIFVARVIFAEAASATLSERYLVASVIKNRMRHKGFSKGNLLTMQDVVKETVGKNKVKAFSAIDDDKNRQWKKTEDISKLTKDELKIWNECLMLSRGDFKPYRHITAYHDNSISMPTDWKTNKYWTYTQVLKTNKFTFYSVTEKPKSTGKKKTSK